MLSTARREVDLMQNAKISLYPDGKHKLLICSRALFRPPGWEPAEDKPKGPKPQTKGTDVRDDNVLRAMHTVYDIARLTKFDYFVTWTLDKEKIDRYDAAEVSKKLRKFLNNQVNRRNLRYLVIPEHHKDGAIHMHGLISGDFDFEDSGRKTDAGQIIYNMPQWSYGWSTAIKLDGNTERISGYITKYISKDFRKIFGNFYYAGGVGLVRHPETILADVEYHDFEVKEYSKFGKGYKYAQCGDFADDNTRRIMDILGGLI